MQRVQKDREILYMQERGLGGGMGRHKWIKLKHNVLSVDKLQGSNPCPNPYQ